MDERTLVEARALGDPTRFALFRHLLDASGPVRITELATVGQVTENAVRQHLAVLLEAGVVSESTAPPEGRGRPPRQFEPTPAALARWGGGQPHARLTALLTEVIDTGDGARVVGQRAGRRFAAERDPAVPLVAALTALMRSLGFGPRFLEDADDIPPADAARTVVLSACPFAALADRSPDVICTLHHGVVEGFVEGSDVRAVDLWIEDPYRAGCAVVLRT